MSIVRIAVPFLVALLAFVAYRYNSRPSFPDNKIFTKEELSKYGSSHPDNPGVLLLAVLGEVFDVTAGAKFYRSGEGYSFFTGRDATRAFQTGKFEQDLTDDISDFSAEQMLDVFNWKQTYHNKYTYVGKVVGRFYDEAGQPLPALSHATQLHTEGLRLSQLKEERKRQNPPCNYRSSGTTSPEVWCTKKSGGIERSWIGHPRRWLDTTTQHVSCVCFPSVELAEGYSLYDGCEPSATLCKLPLVPS